MARIVGEGGSLDGRSWSIDPGLTFGREAHNTIPMPDNRKSSRDHAKVWREGPGRYAIADLGSTNGTLVNDEAITKKPLSDGDEVRIGEWVFRFLLDEEEKPKAKASPPSRAADALRAGAGAGTGAGGGIGGSAGPGAAPAMEIKSRILQYSKKDAKGSFVGNDLSQSSDGRRWLMILAAAAVAAGLYFAARMATGG